MSRSVWLLAALALGACNKDKGGDTAGGGDTDSGNLACDVTVDSTVPDSGAVDAYWQSDIEFHLSDADDTAVLALTQGGTAVSGTSWLGDDADVVYFTPDSPLSPSTSYTATASLCGGDLNPSIDFTTDSYGTALDADITDNTYVVDLANARFVKPEGVADLLLGQLNNDILIGVQSYDDSTLQMIGAMSTEIGGPQDFCNASIPFPEADFTGAPYFAVGPEDTLISVAGYDIEISNLVISGTFAADGSSFGGAVLAGELDARVLAPLLVDLVGTDDPDEICALLVGFGVACDTCSADGQPYCIDILADQMTAELKADTVLECVPETDCNEQCADSADNADCDTSDYPVCE